METCEWCEAEARYCLKGQGVEYVRFSCSDHIRKTERLAALDLGDHWAHELIFCPTGHPRKPKPETWGTVEEELFREFDPGWDDELPVLLITYPDGRQDLHRQTGEAWDQAILRAEEVLKARGLGLRTKEPETIGPSGGYIQVMKL